MNADIQAMPDGEAKTTAMKETQMAEEFWVVKHGLKMTGMGRDARR